MKLNINYGFGIASDKDWTDVEKFIFRTETLIVWCTEGNSNKIY